MNGSGSAPPSMARGARAAGLTAVLCLLLLVPVSPPPSAQVPGLGLGTLPRVKDPPWICGTVRVADPARGLRAAAALPLPLGTPLDYIQDPPILTADYTGRVWIRNLGLVGDVRTVRFRRWDGVTETWRRTRRRQIAGQTISQFTKSWPVRKILSSLWHGYDNPSDFLGTLHAPAGDYYVRLRIATTNLPSAPVRPISNRVQYSSHVVNLRVDSFSTRQLTAGAYNFDFVAAAQLFYQHFADVYDGLSFALQRDVLADYGAFHFNVRNQVGGIGLSVFNDAPRYGSGGKLKGIELYRGGSIATNDTSSHEAMHQWGDYFDLTGIAGVTSAGHHPDAHMPLIFPRENYIGAVLEANRRVRRVGGDVYRIQQTPSPIRQHPLHLYAMGLMGAGAVPNIFVFDKQGQFDSISSSSPSVGTLLRGGTRIVTMNDIIARHGPRTGPVQRVWRRATILISVGRLATQQEMNYWNFFAKRIGEKANTTSLGGVPSFFESTQRKMRLQTDIDPRGRPKVPVGQGGRTTFRDYSRRDWRGVVFDHPVPSRFVRNRRYTASGRVTLTDHAYEQILIRLDKADGTIQRLWGDIRNGRFSVTGRFPRKGNWAIAVYLFYPGAGQQYPVARVSGIIVP